MALLSGGVSDSIRYEQRYRSDAHPKSARQREAQTKAFRQALEYLDSCGLHTIRDPIHKGSIRIDPQSLADAEALAVLDANVALTEDLAHILVALADASQSSFALESHSAAAKLLRDFNLTGPEHLEHSKAPTSTKTQRALRDALANSKLIFVRYRKENAEVVERVLEPLTHVLVNGEDFLVAFDRSDHRTKTFHYERFLSVTIQHEGFMPRELDLSRLFNPPFAYTDNAESHPETIVFSMERSRESAVRFQLSLLFCDGCGIWEDGDFDQRRWIVEAIDPRKAAEFALALGIDLIAPATYREAYRSLVRAARDTFALSAEHSINSLPDEDTQGNRS